MIAELYQQLMRVRTLHVMDGLNPISPGMDIAYEMGRRIGVRQGMDTILTAFNKFHDDQDTKDKEL